MGELATVNLFVMVGGKPVVVIRKGNRIDQDRIGRYLRVREDFLWIELSELEGFVDERYNDLLFTVDAGQRSVGHRVESALTALQLVVLDAYRLGLTNQKAERVVQSAEKFCGWLKEGSFRAQSVQRILAARGNPLALSVVGPTVLAAGTLFVRDHAMKTGTESVIAGSLLRDIGLMGMSQDVWTRSWNELTQDEKLRFQAHPVEGAKLIQQFGLLNSSILEIIQQHHEHPLGTGYPNGRRGHEIYAAAHWVKFSEWLFRALADFLEIERGMNGKIVNYITKRLPDEFGPEHQQAAIGLVQDSFGKKLVISAS